MEMVNGNSGREWWNDKDGLRLMGSGRSVGYCWVRGVGVGQKDDQGRKPRGYGVE